MFLSLDKSLSARLWELGKLFLKLGLIGFGGPAAHIALMEREIVTNRQWITREEFIDLLGATNLIPGPNSTEMAIHIGRLRAGIPGLITAGVAFILPAFIIVMMFGWAYKQWGSVPQIEYLLYGVKPVLIIILVEALWSLGRNLLRTFQKGALCLGCCGFTWLGNNEFVLLLLAGLFVVIFRFLKERRNSDGINLAFLPALIPAAQITSQTIPSSAAPDSLLWLFLKIGSVLYGSGYVLLAFLRSEFVIAQGWLTESQLLDAIAVGQITPGPVFTAATFVGYIVAGPLGGITATIGIFLPAFVFVALSAPLIPKIRKSPTAGAFLDGVNIASLALMLVVTIQLGRTSILDFETLAIMMIAGLVAWKIRINSAWLILGGMSAGWLVGQVR